MDFVIEAFFKNVLKGFVYNSKTKKAPRIFRYYVLRIL